MLLFLKKMATRVFPGYVGSRRPFSSLVKSIELPELQAIDSVMVAQRPELIAAALKPSVTRLRSELPPAWAKRSQTELTYVLASTVAHRLKPYGKGCSSPQFGALLEAPFLDCSNYGLLTWYISGLMLDEIDRRPLSFVGWDGGAIGSHQMLLLGSREQTAGLMLDPTLGIASIASFDEIASGKPIARNSIAIIGATPQLADSREAFVTALLEGQCRPSDLLYYFHSAEDFLNRYGNPFDWPTPAVDVLRKHYAVIV